MVLKTLRAHSLLDDPAFVTELVKLDDDLPSFDDAAMRPWVPLWIDDVAVAPRHWEVGRALIAIGGSFALMCIGGGIAAAVFQDRLALLLR